MKKQYIQPEVQVTTLQTTIIMQAASPAGDSMGVFNEDSPYQW